MSIFCVVLLLLITSDWINQQIDEISQGFDISSNILCDQISDKGTSILRWCSAPNWLWLSWLVADSKDGDWHYDVKMALTNANEPAQLCEYCCYYYNVIILWAACSLLTLCLVTCLWHLLDIFPVIEIVMENTVSESLTYTEMRVYRKSKYLAFSAI